MASQDSDQAAAEGGCLCGALRYRIAGGAEPCVYCCHCRDCQRLASIAFADCLLPPASGFALLRAPPRTVIWRPDPGREMHSVFCPGCCPPTRDCCPPPPRPTG